MSGGKGRAVDSCRPIIVWAPDPDCEHGVDADCEHGVWVDTRVTRDTLARGSLVVALRKLDDDDYEVDRVTVDDTLAVTCALDTGAVTPVGPEGAIFLRRHPWLEEALRAELSLFRRRAERAAAQLDRETAAKRALARPGTTMLRYYDLFPADWDLLPIHAGERYWAVDLYCRNPDCTCTSSVINVYRLDDDDTRLVGEVVLDYADDDPRAEPSSPEAAEVFKTLWAESEYKLRARHAEASQAVRRLAPPSAAPVAVTAPTGRVQRNAPCPCGSGKKYKRCCLGAPATRPGGNAPSGP
jgi:hypothetical protein